MFNHQITRSHKYLTVSTDFHYHPSIVVPALLSLGIPCYNSLHVSKEMVYFLKPIAFPYSRNLNLTTALFEILVDRLDLIFQLHQTLFGEIIVQHMILCLSQNLMLT